MSEERKKFFNWVLFGIFWMFSVIFFLGCLDITYSQEREKPYVPMSIITGAYSAERPQEVIILDDTIAFRSFLRDQHPLEIDQIIPFESELIVIFHRQNEE